MNIPKSEQIEAILGMKEHDLAKKYGFLNSDDIQWSISKNDIKEWIESNGFPTDWVSFTPQKHDGHYVIERGKETHVYYQERSIQMYDKYFDEKDEALDYILDSCYLNRNGIT